MRTIMLEQEHTGVLHHGKHSINSHREHYLYHQHQLVTGTMGKTKGRKRHCPCCNSDVSLRTWYRHQNKQPVYPRGHAAVSKRRRIPVDEVERILLDDTAESDVVRIVYNYAPNVLKYSHIFILLGILQRVLLSLHFMT